MQKKTKEVIKNIVNKSFIILFILYLIAVVLSWYFIKIPIGFNILFIWWIIGVLAIFFVGILFYNSIIKPHDFRGVRIFKFNKYPNKGLMISLIALQLIGVIIIVIILSNLIAGPVFNAAKYKSATSYQEITTAKILPQDTKEFPIVDAAYAEKLGDKVLGNQRLGTYFHVGEYEDIIYKGKFVMVAPLEHNDFFKWFKKKVSPGYIIVDKYTGQVELINNKKLKYLPSAYLNNNLERHTALNNIYQIYSSRFELDDKGTPYFITNNYQPSSFLKLPLVNSVVSINASTGEVRKYKIGQQPRWIDNVYHPDYQRELINLNLKYVHGWFNSLSFTSQEDVMSLSYGDATNPNTNSDMQESSYRYLEINNEIYMYSGVTSIGKDESLTGFMLTNIKTGKNNFIKSGAISEIAAMESIMGELQNYKYTATFPILTNLDNKLVYFMSMKDSSGLIKGYGLVDVIDMSKLAYGKTVSEAYYNYTKKALLTTNTNENAEKIKLKIKRINFDQTSNTYYIVSTDNKIYTIPANISNELVNTRDNDSIEIKFDEANRIYYFNNLTY